jgi:hypothetical protein
VKSKNSQTLIPPKVIAVGVVGHPALIVNSEPMHQVRLFNALARARAGHKSRVDGHPVIRNWEIHGSVHLHVADAGADAVFEDQDVDFSDDGAAQALDTIGRSRLVRIEVVVDGKLVPYSKELRARDLIDPPAR